MKLFEVKDDIILEDLQDLQPAMWVLLTAAIMYCKENNLTCRITSIINDRKHLKNVRSSSHSEGRAIDLGVRDSDGWNDVHIQRLCFRLNEAYKDIAAISASDHVPRAAIAKSNHIHLQVRPNISITKFVKE